MNRDDIIRMAKEAGYKPLVPRAFADDLQEIFIQKFAALVAAAEREACAKTAEVYGLPGVGAVVAAAIRARGEK